MKMKTLYVPMVMAVMVATNCGLAAATTTARPTAWTSTRGPTVQNLNGKMFTLSRDRGRISFYPPYYSPPTTPGPTTRPYPTPTTPWTTAPPATGVSVCVRYIIDLQSTSYPTIFTLSPSRSPLELQTSFPNQYTLFSDRYRQSYLYLNPNIRFWSNIGPDIWTRVCLTVDSVKNVAQVFSGSSFSIRKLMPTQYVWSGEPVIEFSGFDGQVTDVHVWDYPLRYKEIFNYMTNRVYAPYSGSVLTWSSIRYSPAGNTLLEDVYESQARQPIRRRSRGGLPEGVKKTREFFNNVETEEKKTEQL